MKGRNAPADPSLSIPRWTEKSWKKVNQILQSLGANFTENTKLHVSQTPLQPSLCFFLYVIKNALKRGPRSRSSSLAVIDVDSLTPRCAEFIRISPHFHPDQRLDCSSVIHSFCAHFPGLPALVASYSTQHNKAAPSWIFPDDVDCFWGFFSLLCRASFSFTARIKLALLLFLVVYKPLWPALNPHPVLMDCTICARSAGEVEVTHTAYIRSVVS